MLLEEVESALENKAPLLSDVQGVGPLLWTFSPHTSPCLHGTRKNSHQSECAPVYRSFLPALASVGIRQGSHWSKHTHPNCDHLIPLLSEQTNVSHSVAAITPSCLGGEQTTEGGPHTEVGPKPNLNLRGCEKKEEELKVHCATPQVVD